MADEIVRSISLELVSRLVPEELPLFKTLTDQFEHGNRRRRKESPDDPVLGFGAGEVVALMTPVILSFTQGFWDALMAKAADITFVGVVKEIRQLRSGNDEAPGAIPPLTAEQLQLIRKVADQETRRLAGLPEAQARLLTDALVGALTSPQAS